MSVKPILFNTEMVRAILDGRKTCTRRVIKSQPDEKHIYPLGYVTDSTEKKNVGCFGFGIDEYSGSVQYAKQPYHPGDILYVRETFIQAAAHTFWYKADDKSWMSKDLLWKPSIHMPKEAARIWLKVTDVRVERLQEISGKDLIKEGIDLFQSNYVRAAFDEFKNIWNSTIKKSDLDRYGWDASPWVWVIEFERCEKPEGV
jgi:hypothetical protein|nr:MAG TPA: ASCH domain protein [Caudoviricetes sp.]